MFSRSSTFLFVCLLWSVQSYGTHGEDLFVELTDETFEDAVATPDMIIVKFYAPWCVHCHNLVPAFQEVARQLKPFNITVARVNIEKEKKTQAKFEILTLPAVRIFRRGIVYDYDGPTQEKGTEALVEYFMKEKDKTLDNPIIELTDDNFDEITKATELILVDFFVKECLPCKQLEPHFLAAARRLIKNDPPIQLGSLDVPKSIETAKKFGLQKYPHLIIFRYGEIYNYTGPKEENGIVEYMKKQAGPSSTFLESIEAARAFSQSSTETCGIGFFSSETSADALKTYTKSGNLARMDLKLGHTTDPAIAKQLSFPLNSVVVFHPRNVVTKYEAGYTVVPNVDEGETAESLVTAYLDASRPLVGQMTRDNHMRAYKYRPLLVAYYEVNWDREHNKDTLYWHSIIADVAVKYKDTKLAFAIANEADFPSDIQALGFASWGEEVAVGLFAPGPRKYRLMEELNRDSLIEFVDNFFEGNLEPYYSSEIAPKKGTGPIRTIVGSSFEKIVYDPKINVVVMLCIPSMDKCRESMEWFYLAAKKYHKKDKSILFGDINVELNDVPLEFFKLDDLPTIFFSPKGSKGETDLIRVDPLPQDEIDLSGWLRSKGGIPIPKDEL